ncbi:hypothetical protein IWX81_002424 [Salinibacterium sp. CAN_S4]|uniref:hypothetical protein n=1 Tax=Salinibacterium sp. CAN_S4 TaxID=2787727 RepID=UPI0018F03A46
MTIATPSTARDQKPAAPIRWKVVQPGLWIGHRDREFAGMIESTMAGDYAAMTNLGQQLGTFPSVDAAKQSFTD